MAAGLWPASPVAIGLGLSGNRVAAVRVERAGDGYCVTHAAEERLPFIPFRGLAPRAEDAAIFAQAIQRLAMAVPQGHCPLQIALPDPAAIFQVLEFDTLPGTAQERAAIARFRLEKEWPAVAQMECAFQVLNEEGRAMLIASAVQRAWLDWLREGCRTAGFAPGVADIGLSHIFNRFHDVIAKGKGDGVLISIEPDTWSVLLWDQDRRPRFVRSRWRDSGSEEDEDYGAIAQDVERLVRAYVLASPGRRIDGIYLCANEAVRAPFADRMNARMSAPCILLDMAEEFSGAPDISIRDISPGVLAAAIQRS